MPAIMANRPRLARKATRQPFTFNGKCYQTTGPAPGATGQGGNLWSELAPKLARSVGRPVIFSILAVESTRIRDWVEPGKLRQKLNDTITGQRQYGFVPDLVLWQQGEADAKAGTTRAKYLEQLNELVTTLRSGGLSAPIVVALSTSCHNVGSESVRSALKAAAATDPTIQIGPDTDVLTGSFRQDDCHFSTMGQRAAAELWLATLPKLDLVDANRLLVEH